jgi:MraZ protein
VEQDDITLEQEIAGQGVFVHRYEHTLDPKKRLTIPSPWRAQVSEPKSLYVLPDVHDKCLSVYPAGEIVRRIKAMREHSIADPKARQFARVLASHSDLVSWDAQGRIRVKDELMDYAGLEEKVILIGAFDRFELWNPENLKKAGDLSRDGMLEAAQYVGF